MGFFLLDNPNPYTPQWVYPRRGSRGKLTGTCIVHTAENMIDLIGPDSAAEDVANFIRRRADYGCYHTLVDSDSIMELVPYEYETWQDSETNNWAVGISAAVRADGWNTIPLARRLKIYRNLAWAAADFVKYMRDAYNIRVPFKRISGAQARAGMPGFCAHGDSGIARTDPGVQFDWTLFFRYAVEELAKMDGAKPIEPIKETDDMSVKSPEFQVVPPKDKVPALKKGIGWYLKKENMTGNANLAASGPGHYVAEVFIQGSGLNVGEELEVTCMLVTGARKSGYYTQTISGTEDGTFRDSVTFNQRIEKGTEVWVLVTTSAVRTELNVWGMKALVVS